MVANICIKENSSVGNKGKQSWSAYYKLILERVGFDPNLLLKEYKKALAIIHPSELGEFQQWMITSGLHQKLNVPLKNQ